MNSLNTDKRKILAFFDFFYPAYKSGGPARSSLGIIESLGSKIDFKVFTRSTDKDFKIKLDGIEISKWSAVKGAYVYYSKSALEIILAVRKIQFQMYYFNSFFSAPYTILPIVLIYLRLIPHKKIVLAPRGEFSSNALAIKNTKKRFYLKLFKKFILKDNITFHASSDLERWDIIKATNVRYSQVKVAINLRPISEFNAITDIPISKEIGELKMVFISRISQMKNIDFALDVLKNCKTNITLDIFGIIDDVDYWNLCKSKIENLPRNIKVSYLGEASQSEVFKLLQNYHVMFLPTRGENFGHSILESFMAGRPALISNVTIWKNLIEKKAGWDLPLQKPALFTQLIDELNKMDNETYQKYLIGSKKLAHDYFENNLKTVSYQKLFSA